jgi:hypothetical protein
VALGVLSTRQRSDRRGCLAPMTVPCARETKRMSSTHAAHHFIILSSSSPRSIAGPRPSRPASKYYAARFRVLRSEDLCDPTKLVYRFGVGVNETHSARTFCAQQERAAAQPHPGVAAPGLRWPIEEFTPSQRVQSKIESGSAPMR